MSAAATFVRECLLHERDWINTRDAQAQLGFGDQKGAWGALMKAWREGLVERRFNNRLRQIEWKAVAL